MRFNTIVPRSARSFFMHEPVFLAVMHPLPIQKKHLTLHLINPADLLCNSGHRQGRGGHTMWGSAQEEEGRCLDLSFIQNLNKGAERESAAEFKRLFCIISRPPPPHPPRLPLSEAQQHFPVLSAGSRPKGSVLRGAREPSGGHACKSSLVAQKPHRETERPVCLWEFCLRSEQLCKH